MMQRWWALMIALAGAILLAIVATTPPGALGADAPTAAFSATRAMIDDRVIGRAPHPTGSTEDAHVRDHLVRRLSEMGLEVTLVPGTMSPEAKKRLDGWRGSPAAAPPLTNILAILPGKDRSQPAVLLMAHHDSVWGSPGAADDGAGVASVLETVRALRAGTPPQRDLMVLFTDGEELGLEGAKSFFSADPHSAHVGVIVNAETRGGGGRATMFETGDRNGAMLQLFGENVRRPVGTSLSTFIYKKLPNSTDYTVAKKRGVPGFNFAFIGRASQYHSPTATPEALDQGALQDMGRQVLDLTRALLDAPTLPGRAPDRVFFDAFGLFLVAYPGWVGWLMLVIGVTGYASAAWRRATLAETVKSAGMTLAVLVVAGLGLYLVNLVSEVRGEGNYYDRLAAIPRLEWQALAVCLAVFVALRRWMPSRNGAVAGAAVPLLLFGALAQVAAPTAAYIFLVPLMLGGLALAIERFAARSAGMVATVVVAMLGVGYMIGFGFFLLQAVGPGLPMVATIPLAISVVLLLPIVPVIERARANWTTGILLLLALGIALWVRLDALAPSVAVYSTANGIH
uniref:M20/M25/M40 family metallo-hydrolase n=1 Tax=Sphingomonas sp. TaxID=28214 RepID=UPI0025FBC4E7|nr:M20/M25/M40 family metallo-hydrolase [Sphingomonas sp.]